MAMKKTGDAQKIDVAYYGEEAGIVNEHLSKTGKAISEFNRDEKRALQEELESFRSSREEELGQSGDSEEPEENKANLEDEE